MKSLITALSLSLALSLTACDATPFDPAVDVSQDSGTDTLGDCTEWGRISTCPDGTIGCDAMVCLSHDPALPKCPTSLPCGK
jgi:hypothetical protein